MKLVSLLESEKVGATLFFNCDFYYDGYYDDGLKKNGDLRITIAFPSAAESDDFIQKCRTSIMERFFKEYMEGEGCETLLEEIVNNSSAAEEYSVLKITKVEIDGDIAMSSARTAGYRQTPAKQNTDNSKWYYTFFFDNIEQFVKTLACCSGESVVRKHFGSAEGMLDTLTL